MNDKSRDCLVKILLECDKIEERRVRFGMDREVFVHDAAYADMLLMPLAQIGELSVHVDSEVLRTIMPLTVWRQVRGFRNIIVHSYGSINREWAWETVVRDVPQLKEAVLNLEELRVAYEHEREALEREAVWPG